MTIALDAMGGDFGPDVVVPAAVEALGMESRPSIVLVGAEDIIEARLKAFPEVDRTRLRVQHATQVVGMDEPPSQALRSKKDSSMRVAIDLVRRGQASACVSAGNTGALMATARFVLKTMPGIDRPAICTALPSFDGHTHVLDLGANVDSRAEHLLEFAVMGSVLASAVDGLERPKVGLLNVGAEEIKGNEQVKKAAALLDASELNYVGFVEGDGIFFDDVDVVVCDGFVGNVSLKSIEGIAKLIRQLMKAEFDRNLLTRAAGLVSLPVLRALGRRIDPRRYNGASLLGLQGIVIKSHGGADAVSFANAIRIATLEVAKAVPQRIHQHLGATHPTRQAL